MARRESPREDLIRDAVALVDRIEFISANQAPVVVGFRQDGSASFYFGEEPVYQFNSDGALRRAHVNGIIKVENGRLVRLSKRRSEGQVQLIRHELDDGEQQRLLAAALDQLSDLQARIEQGRCEATREVSAAPTDLRSRVCEWLAALPHKLPVAQEL